MPSDLPTICEERLRLLREYSDAAMGYSTRVGDLAAWVNAGDEVRANEAQRMCRIARDATEETRLALFRHEADHNCSRGVDVRKISEA